MKKYIALLFLAVCPFIGLKATHFPAYKAVSIKCISHDSLNIYILNQQGIEIFNKSTGTSTLYNKETGYFSEHWYAYVLSRPYGGVGLNYLTLRPDTIWVGSNDGILYRITDGVVDSTKHYCDLNEFETMESIVPMGINGIVFDSKGNIVIGGSNCFNVIYPTGEEDSFTFPSIHYGNEIWQMVIDKNDDIWVSSTGAGAGNGLIKYHVGGELEVISDNSKNPPFRSAYVKGMTIDNDGHLWFGSSHKDQVSEDRVESRAKLLKYDGNEFTSYDIGPGVEVPISMMCDSRGRIWYLPTAPIDYVTKISEYSKGPLCCFDNGEVTRYEWSQDAGYCYCVDIDGDSIYIGTDNGVLVFCDGAFRWLNNDEAGISDASSPQSLKTATFDLQGRRIQGEPKHGVYIRNGKKVMK